MSCDPSSFNFLLLIFFNFPYPAAARSLATPLTPKQSGLLGVIDKSSILGLLFLKYLLPILFWYFFEESSIIPSVSYTHLRAHET